MNHKLFWPSLYLVHNMTSYFLFMMQCDAAKQDSSHEDNENNEEASERSSVYDEGDEESQIYPPPSANHSWSQHN